MITGESEGSATIMVSTYDTNFSEFCNVTVTKKGKTPSPSTQLPDVPNYDYPVIFVNEGFDASTGTSTACTTSMGYKVDKNVLSDYRMNDTFSSIYVPVGWRVTLCRDDDFNGSTHIFEAKWDPVIKSKLDNDINNETSAVIFEKIADDPRLPVIYQDSAFRGNAQTLDVGSYRANQLSFGNDQISSIKIPAGYKITLYEHDNFQGSSVTYTWQQANVGVFNDKFSSIRVWHSGIFYG